MNLHYAVELAILLLAIWVIYRVVQSMRKFRRAVYKKAFEDSNKGD